MATLDEIDAQIRALEDQKKQIQQKAKDAALSKANAAIEELRKLGYNYRLTEAAGTARAAPSGGGTRRTGQREAVLSAVKSAPAGLTAGQVLEAMEATTDAEKTSVRNALSALKKAGTLKLDGGTYTA